jgi:hypothetical protein
MLGGGILGLARTRLLTQPVGPFSRLGLAGTAESRITSEPMEASGKLAQ